jgi:hypothetical protein
MPFPIDNAAREVALTRWALPESLHFPVAAVDENAITTYVGEIEQVLADGSPRRAFLVRTKEPPPIDTQFPIWELPTAKILHERLQVWVHIEFTRYRHAYRKAFPDEAIDGKVLSHALNRRMAALMGFSYVRITPNSRGCNSSSSFSEQWGVALHATPEQVAANRRRGAFIHYADLAALVVMLDMKPGGGVMDAVNEAQKLVRPRPRPARAERSPRPREH